MRLRTRIQHTLDIATTVDVTSAEAFQAIRETFVRSRNLHWSAVLILTGDEGLNLQPQLFRHDLGKYKGQWVTITPVMPLAWTVTPLRKADKFEIEIIRELAHIEDVIHAYEAQH